MWKVCNIHESHLTDFPELPISWCHLQYVYWKSYIYLHRTYYAYCTSIRHLISISDFQYLYGTSNIYIWDFQYIYWTSNIYIRLPIYIYIGLPIYIYRTSNIYIGLPISISDVRYLYWTSNIYICYSYTTVRVWYRSYYTSTRRSRVRVLISYKYTWYNWLVPCQKNWNQHFSKHLYFAKQDRYTLLEQSVSLSNWLFY